MEVVKIHIKCFTEKILGAFSKNSKGKGDSQIQYSKFDSDIHPVIVNKLNNLRALCVTTRGINSVIYKGNMNRTL